MQLCCSDTARVPRTCGACGPSPRAPACSELHSNLLSLLLLLLPPTTKPPTHLLTPQIPLGLVTPPTLTPPDLRPHASKPHPKRPPTPPPRPTPRTRYPQTIQTDLHSTPELVAASVAIYMFFVGAWAFVWGPACDAYGRRPVLLLNTLVFVGASLGCIFAPNIQLLIAFRALQGAAGG